MGKPNIFKTRRQKRIERKTDTIIGLIGLAVAVKDYQQRTEKTELENENLRLQNRILELEEREKQKKM